MSSSIINGATGVERSTCATVVFDGRGAKDLLGDTGDEVLHHVGVVGVGPVELQHRELGIVPSRHPRCGTPADLKHLLHAANDQPLQVEPSDAQVEVLPMRCDG